MIEPVSSTLPTPSTMQWWILVIRATPDRDPRLETPPPTWIPRPAPSGARLVVDDLLHRAAMPFAVAAGVRRAVTHPRRVAAELYERAESVVEAIGAGLSPAPATPLNATIGPHRRFDWAEMDLDAVKAVRTRLGGTINDVVLAVLTGGMRRFLRGRGVDVDHLDFRAMMPVKFAASLNTSTRRRMLMATMRRSSSPWSWSA
jgi:hypothetical protein